MQLKAPSFADEVLAMPGAIVPWDDLLNASKRFTSTNNKSNDSTKSKGIPLIGLINKTNNNEVNKTSDVSLKQLNNNNELKYSGNINTNQPNRRISASSLMRDSTDSSEELFDVSPDKIQNLNLNKLSSKMIQSTDSMKKENWFNDDISPVESHDNENREEDESIPEIKPKIATVIVKSVVKPIEVVKPGEIIQKVISVKVIEKSNDISKTTISDGSSNNNTNLNNNASINANNTKDESNKSNSSKNIEHDLGIVRVEDSSPAESDNEDNLHNNSYNNKKKNLSFNRKSSFGDASFYLSDDNMDDSFYGINSANNSKHSLIGGRELHGPITNRVPIPFRRNSNPSNSNNNSSAHIELNNNNNTAITKLNLEDTATHPHLRPLDIVKGNHSDSNLMKKSDSFYLSPQHKTVGTDHLSQLSDNPSDLTINTNTNSKHPDTLSSPIISASPRVSISNIKTFYPDDNNNNKNEMEIKPKLTSSVSFHIQNQKDKHNNQSMDINKSSSISSIPMTIMMSSLQQTMQTPFNEHFSPPMLTEFASYSGIFLEGQLEKKSKRTGFWNKVSFVYIF